MTIVTMRRSASYEEIVAEMDRRGRVIEELQRERDELREALKLPDVDRRQWFISFCLKKFGFFNRGDICQTFSVSVPQASLDVRKWLEANPGIAFYNTSRKRYERIASSVYTRSLPPVTRATAPSPDEGEAV